MRIAMPNNAKCPVTGRIESYGRQACSDCPHLDNGECEFGIAMGDFKEIEP